MLLNNKRYLIHDLIFVALILILSITYFHKILLNNVMLVHGDLRYAMTVYEQIYYHLKNLYTHAPKIPILSLMYPISILLGDRVALS